MNKHYYAASSSATANIAQKLTPARNTRELESVSAEERVGQIVKFTGNLRGISTIDGKFYACGMDRVVLRRTSTGRWTLFGPGPLAGDPQVVGFEDIAGYSASEMYAVGWGGEIWCFDRKKWRRADSPITTILSSMTCTADGTVYVVGHDGVMLRGRQDQWELLETGRTENLKDVAQLDGQIHVCTDFALFRLTDDGLAPETEFADPADMPNTCLRLLEAEGELVSLGTKDVFVKRTGKPWSRLV